MKEPTWGIVSICALLNFKGNDRNVEHADDREVHLLNYIFELYFFSPHGFSLAASNNHTQRVCLWIKLFPLTVCTVDVVLEA